MSDEKIQLEGKLEVPVTATQQSEVIVGEDLAMIVRAFGARDPGPLLTAARENPELLQFLPGFADLDRAANGIEDAIDRLDKAKDAE